MDPPTSYLVNKHYFASKGPSLVFPRKKHEDSVFEKTELTSMSDTICTKPKKQFISKIIENQISMHIPSSNESKTDAKVRDLSPSTLGAILKAELDHYIKVETEIGHYAEIETNYQKALHERTVAAQFIDDIDDREETKQLEFLDAEIMKLQGMLETESGYYSEMEEE